MPWWHGAKKRHRKPKKLEQGFGMPGIGDHPRSNPAFVKTTANNPELRNL
jgi:hypothetical protein